MMDPAVEIIGLKKSFQGIPVLKGLDLTAVSHQLTVIIGPSGCGKSTLLRCLTGLEPMDEGRITVNGLQIEKTQSGGKNEAEYHKVAHRLRSVVGMVFQGFNLFPHMSTFENVAKPPVIVQGMSKSEARAVALQLLQKVGLQDKMDLYPAQLSGGQQQRAAIARALAMKPKVLLYDEPTSALDPGLVDEVLEVMRELHREGITQVVVTHEMRFAREVGDKIVFISDGVVVEEGNPEKMFGAPEDYRTRQFLKRCL